MSGSAPPSCGSWRALPVSVPANRSATVKYAISLRKLFDRAGALGISHRRPAVQTAPRRHASPQTGCCNLGPHSGCIQSASNSSCCNPKGLVLSLQISGTTTQNSPHLVWRPMCWLVSSARQTQAAAPAPAPLPAAPAGSFWQPLHCGRRCAARRRRCRGMSGPCSVLSIAVSGCTPRNRSSLHALPTYKEHHS